MSQQFGTGTRNVQTPARRKELGSLKIIFGMDLDSYQDLQPRDSSMNRSVGRKVFSASSSLGLDRHLDLSQCLTGLAFASLTVPRRQKYLEMGAGSGMWCLTRCRRSQKKVR
jgi:hypothetical protein